MRDAEQEIEFKPRKSGLLRLVSPHQNLLKSIIGGISPQSLENPTVEPQRWKHRSATRRNERQIPGGNSPRLSDMSSENERICFKITFSCMTKAKRTLSRAATNDFLFLFVS